MRLREFSKAIGVSTATASQAISGRGVISEKTRKYVLQKMEELGYRPNPQGQALATGSSNIVGLVYGTPNLLLDPLEVELARGIQTALAPHGYAVLLDAMDDSRQEMHLIRKWTESATLDGLIWFTASQPAPEWIRLAAKRGTPVVAIGRVQPDTEPITYVSWQIDSEIRQVVDLLIEAGHKTIAYLGVREQDRILQSLIGILNEKLLDLPQEYIRYTQSWTDDNDLLATDLLSMSPRPTAIIARKDELAVSAFSQATRLGLNVPADLSVVGIDGVHVGKIIYPQLTTIKLDCIELGTALVDTLMKKIKSDSEPPSHLELPGRLVIGGTIGRVHKSDMLERPTAKS